MSEEEASVPRPGFSGLPWFKDRNYHLIYWHRFFFVLAESAAMTFRAGFLYANHMDLPVIILLLSLYFLVSAGVAPLSYLFFNQSIKALFSTVASLNVASYLLLSPTTMSIPLAIVSMALSGGACGLYYPVSDVLESMYVEESAHRGRQMTFGVAMSTLGAAVGAVAGGLAISNAGYLGVATLMAVAYVAGLIPAARLDIRSDATVTRRLADVVSFMQSADYRPFYAVHFAGQLWIIMQYFVPLYLYLVAGDYATLGLIVAGAALLQCAAILVFGHLIDGDGHAHGLARSFYANSAATAGLLFFCTGPFTAFIVQSVNNLAANMLNSAWLTTLHEKLLARRDDPVLFGTALQISFCAFEVLTLPVYALLAFFVGNAVFPVMFVAGLGGVCYMWRKLPAV